MAARAREPYVDFHPGPGDATAHFADEAMRRAAGSPHVADGDRVTTTVSSIESPSVQIAWRLRMAEIGINLPLEPFFESVQVPHPRLPKTQVDFALWSYEGNPDSEEARFSHNIMAGKPLHQEEEVRKAQAAQQQMAAGDGGDPDPTVFPGQPLAKLSDYVGMMKKMQTGDMNGALAAYGLNMTTYGQVAQAWGTKFGTDPTLNAKMAAMMA